MVKKLKTAIIGCGRMGAEPSRYLGELPLGWHPLSHAEAILETKSLELTAICDINSELLKKTGNIYHINESNQFNDYKCLINEIKPDVITIATRTPPKRDIIQYACLHGVKGIYVEKPLANSLSDCNLILNLIEKYNVKLIYGVNRRYHIAYRTAKKFISEGIIGDIKDVTIDHGKSLLLWTHPHSVDLILYFLDNQHLESIQASMETTKKYNVQDLLIQEDPIVINALFTFSKGMTGKLTNLPGLNIKISGSDGYLMIHGNGEFIETYTKTNNASPYFLENKKIPIINDDHKATVYALESLVRSISTTQILPIRLEEINLGMRMLFGSMWSYLKNGMIVAPNDVPENLLIEGIYNGCHA